MIASDIFHRVLAESQLFDAQFQVFHQGWQVVQQLPRFIPSDCDLQQGVSVQGQPPAGASRLSYQIQLANLLRQLGPWRKGPFDLYGVHVNSEWRSDWKWQRLLPHITPLKGRTVLDVGCANGYYLWRMIGAGARLAIGIDPMGRFLTQFLAIRQLLAAAYPVYLLPFTIEQLPAMATFDTVFSMGVLYHRRSPLQHLQQLKGQLRSGGELVLETLILSGESSPLLLPSKRYAQMRNVYGIPSVSMLKLWLKQCGFTNVRTVNITATTTAEQRHTSWSTQHSLADSLDPEDPSKTIEGYPAPLRVIMLANIL